MLHKDFIQTHVATVTPNQDHCTDRGAPPAVTEDQNNKSGGKEINFVGGKPRSENKKKRREEINKTKVRLSGDMSGL